MKIFASCHLSAMDLLLLILILSWQIYGMQMSFLGVYRYIAIFDD